MVELTGLSGAPGYGAGTAVLLRQGKLSVAPIAVSSPEAEVSALTAARSRYRTQLTLLVNEAHASETAAAAIFEGYRAMADDPAFWNQVEDIVRSRRLCASYAIEQRRLETVTAFLATEDDCLRARAADVSNVCREVMAELQGVSPAAALPLGITDRLVVFAHELSPSDVVRFGRGALAGIVTETGGVTSHVSILSQSLGIPAVVGAGAFPPFLADGLPVLVDGSAGRVLLQPDAARLVAFAQQQDVSRHQQVLFDACSPHPAVTKDGVTVRVCVNSGDRESIDAFDPALCDGVGLFRTEFLYLAQTDYPSEDLQYGAYCAMAHKAAGKELIIRTLDSGGDKQLPYMELPREENPFLGYRAIRLCLDQPELFKTQLRAILRAAVCGNIKLMFPMIVNFEELVRAKALLREAMGELEARGIPFRRDIQVGMMIETPAAVLLSDHFARNVDFFSIGSNDLIQYTTAADRTNQRMGSLYDSCNLSVLRSIRMVCQNAHAAGIPVGICGETASEPRLIPLFCAMGVDELSVPLPLVGRTKYIINRLSQSALQPELDAIMDACSIPVAKDRLNQILLSLPF